MESMVTMQTIAAIVGSGIGAQALRIKLTGYWTQTISSIWKRIY